MATQGNIGTRIPGRRWHLLKACWGTLVMASLTLESTVSHEDAIPLWWVLDASGTLSIPASNPGVREIHTLDLQDSDRTAAEAQIRQWTQTQPSEQPRRLGVLWNGVLHYDPLRSVIDWTAQDGSANGIPVERILRYASRVDPEFTLQAVFRTEPELFAAIADKLDRWLRGSTTAHQILLLAGPESAQFETELQRRNPFLPDAMQPLPSGEPGIGAHRWQWVAGEPGPRAPDRHAPEALALQSPPREGGITAEWELNFDADGGFVRAPAHDPRERQPLPLPLTSTPHAVNGFGLDLLQHPEWIPEAPSSLLLPGLQAGQPANARAWVLWLLPRNLDAEHPSRVVFQLKQGGAGDGRLRTRLRDGRLSVAWEPQGTLDPPETAVDVALVQGVWNLLILHFDSPSQVVPRLERAYPVTWFEIPTWRARYEPEIESPAVRRIATTPQLILDSIRAYASPPPALADSIRRERYERFSVSQLSYSDAQDLDKSIRRESAGRKRLADWDNLKACFEGDGAAFVAHYGIEFEQGYLIQRAGERHFAGNRQYFFNRFDHHPRQSFLVHDHIDQHLISLGSWVRLYLKAFCETLH